MENEPFQIPEPPPPSKQAWMLTFADLLSLMLTFFVMMYAMSAIEQSRWQEVSESLMTRLNPDQKFEYIVQQPDALSLKPKPIAKELSYLQKVLLQRMEGNPLYRDVSLQQRPGELVLILPPDALFGSSRREISKSGGEMLTGIAESLSLIGNQIEVATDVGQRAPDGKRYALEWELSLSRGAELVAALHEAGYAYSINLLGYGERWSGGKSASARSGMEILIRDRQAQD